jgi:hypothetical protein
MCKNMRVFVETSPLTPRSRHISTIGGAGMFWDILELTENQLFLV